MSGVIIFIGGNAKVALADFDVSRFCGSGTLGFLWTGCVTAGPPARPPATACATNSCLGQDDQQTVQS
ncbi:MAG: hypothetical protein EBV31_00875 [Verrucomicrobia bacterium]|nr:hypothetical protein [Verrucomicrobiota bacterium]